MSKRSPENERIKRKYLQHLRRAEGKSEATIDAAAAAIDRFLEANRHKPLSKFRIEQAVAFRDRFEEETDPKTGKLLSRSTVTTTLRALKGFFTWLAGQPGFRSRISYSDAAYFTPLLHDEKIARATRPKYVPSIEQVHHVLALMPAETPIERRNRALVAITILACPRDGATAGIRLKHLDLDKRKLAQYGAEMRTKFRKTFSTYFFQVGGNAEEIVGAWKRELAGEHLFGPDDPLFPKTKTGRGENGGFEAQGLDRAPWRDAAAIRKIFREAFERAKLPYANPHSLRDAVAQFGLDTCKTFADLKAWSQNLGHERMLTTLNSYGNLPEAEQGRLILGLGPKEESKDTLERIRALLEGQTA